MNKEIAGNMTSDVNGFEEVAAATANELKATSRGTPLHSAELHAFVSNQQIKFAKESEKVYHHKAYLTELLQFLIVSNLGNSAYECILPAVQLDATNVCQQLAHKSGTFITTLHLLFLNALHDTRKDCPEHIERASQKNL